jgi:hypothetical protein
MFSFFRVRCTEALHASDVMRVGVCEGYMAWEKLFDNRYWRRLQMFEMPKVGCLEMTVAVEVTSSMIGWLHWCITVLGRNVPMRNGSEEGRNRTSEDKEAKSMKKKAKWHVENMRNRIEYLHTQLSYRDAGVFALGPVAILPNSLFKLRTLHNNLTDEYTGFGRNRLYHCMDSCV